MAFAYSGLAPASFKAATTVSASGCSRLLQGVIVECALATPTIGLPKSVSR